MKVLLLPMFLALCSSCVSAKCALLKSDCKVCQDAIEAEGANLTLPCPGCADFYRECR